MWSNGVFSLRASLPLAVAALLFLSSDGWAQQELRSGKKGATNPAPVTSTSIDADHQALDVNIAGGTLGDVTISNVDGAITDGASAAIKATVLDLTNSNPLTVGIVDSNGDQITSFGGGTQYQQGTASTTTDTMTMAGCVRVDTPAVAAGVIDGDRARCMVDSTGRLWVHVGVIDGTVAVTQSGTWNIATLTGITNPVAVTGTFWQATQPVSGTVTVTDGAGALNVIVDSGTTAATQSGTWTVQPGNTANTTPWLATINQGGNSATVNGSGQLAVNCANCSGSGVSQQDNTGFTPGTTNFVPMGGEVDDTGTTAVTENNAGVARITAQRAVHMNLRNNSGTEIGTSGNPVRTDPTGSTTQPVSGTVSISGTVTVSDGSGALNVICDSGCSGGTQYDEDTAHVSGDKLTLAGVVRSDAAGALAADGDRTVLQVDSNGYLKVVNINPNLAADNSTLSTSKVPVLPGTVSTSAPTWTNGNQSALSLQTDGSVRAAVTAFPDNEPFNIAQMNGVTVSMGVGASGTGTQRVASLIHDGTDTAQVTSTAGGSLQVECTSGCGGAGGTSIADDAAFTPGTTSVTPAGAMFDDVTPDSVNEGDAGVVRMSANRNLYTTLRDAAGNERGANVNASNELLVAATGTVTANAGTNLNTSALLTTSAHDAAFGTAGSADAQVRTVQGIASMTPLQVQSNSASLATEASVDGLEGGLGGASDAAATAGSTGSVTAKLRLMTSQLDTISTAVAAIQTATQLIDDDQTGASGYSYISVGTTEDEHAVKASAGRLFSITATNTNAAVRYLKCENDTAANTAPGTDTPELRIAIPGATTGAGFTANFGPAGFAFSNALTCWLVTGAADNDVAEVAANEIMVFYTYK